MIASGKHDCLFVVDQKMCETKYLIVLQLSSIPDMSHRVNFAKMKIWIHVFTSHFFSLGSHLIVMSFAKKKIGMEIDMVR